jgi:hypothetical protein
MGQADGQLGRCVKLFALIVIIQVKVQHKHLEEQ